MKNKKSLTVGIIVAVIVIALIGSIAGSYNNLVKLRENVTSAQSVVCLLYTSDAADEL